MQTAALYEKQSGLTPGMVCHPLPVFDSADLSSVRRAFAAASPCSFRQAWLDGHEHHFSPGTVRIGWRDDSLLIFAELTDADIFSHATQPNQPMWELGDVFEMFLGCVKAESYVEFHVTPNNHRLQLRYANRAAAEQVRQTRQMDAVVLRGEAFRSRTWIENGAWHVYAEIPASAIYGNNRSFEDTQWRFSFGRYDYTRGVDKPAISSTSPHGKPDFHRQHEWGVMTFNTRSDSKR